jgi:stage IV sporulation protein FB
MFLEPARTAYDLQFHIFRIPVRVSPWFWLLALLLSANGGIGGLAILLCILAAFLSILIHELGHAIAYMNFGMQPHIVLYQFGGLAIANRRFGSRGMRVVDTPQSQILISLAGPTLQMATGLFVFACVRALGYQMPAPMGFLEGRFPEGEKLIPSYLLAIFLMVYSGISVGWALLNLIPVFPLDGGQIARNILVMINGPQTGLRNSIQLSLVVAIGASILFFQSGQPSAGLLFMALAFSSYQLLDQTRAGGFW